MKRWIWKRWAWTGVFGITAAVGLALGAGKDGPPSPAAPPKVGDVVTLKFEKGAEKKVKIVKTERQPDGSYQSEVKDMKSGEVFTLIDKSHMPPEEPKTAAKTGAKAPMAKTSPAPKSAPAAAMTPKAINTKVVTEPPPARTTSPSAAMKPPAPARPNTVAAPAAMPEPMMEPSKKPGLLKRLFGKESPPTMPTPTAPAMPVTSARQATPELTPPGMPVTSAKPPTKPATAPAAPTSVFESGTPVSSKPVTKPRIFSPTTSVFEGAAPRSSAGTAAVSAPKFVPDRATGEPPRGRTIEPNLGSAFLPPMERTVEPPRTLPMNSVTPPKPVIPVPVTPPSTPPTAAPAPLPIPSAPAAIPAPVTSTPSPSPSPSPMTTIPSVPVTPPPTATPAIPVPSTPAIPVPSTPTPVIPAVPTAPALPTIPAVPDGMSMNRSMVMQAGMKSPVAAMAADIQPHVTSLRTAAAPSVRAMAARALSGGRHASSDTVKEVLFIACTSDPSPFVRACCVEELCKLGYFDPAFMAFLHKACADQSEEVRMAAREALKKMTPEK